MIAIPDRPEALAIESAPEAPRPRSGGPRTPEGKERSRRNALKHGLRSKILLPDDLADAVADRSVEFTAEFAPRSPYEEFLVGEMALASARIERCAALAIVDLQRGIERAALCWEGDRRKAVEDLGARLAKDPARIAQALRRSRQGADWLIERWEGLREALRARGDWDDDQRRLAFDLLGVPPELRTGGVPARDASEPGALAALAEGQVARLREDRAAVLDELDDAERAMTEVGMPQEEDAPTARLRKYEASCRRALLWARAEFRRVREESAPAVESSRPSSPPPEVRRAPSASAANYLAARSASVLLTPRDSATEPPARAELPARVTPPPVRPAAAPRNRHERRARERLDRIAAP